MRIGRRARTGALHRPSHAVSPVSAGCNRARGADHRLSPDHWPHLAGRPIDDPPDGGQGGRTARDSAFGVAARRYGDSFEESLEEGDSGMPVVGGLLGLDDEDISLDDTLDEEDDAVRPDSLTLPVIGALLGQSVVSARAQRWLGQSIVPRVGVPCRVLRAWMGSLSTRL